MMYDRFFLEESLREWNERVLNAKAALGIELARMRKPRRPVGDSIGAALIRAGEWLQRWAQSGRMEEESLHQ
jgi:hypothetical protein